MCWHQRTQLPRTLATVQRAQMPLPFGMLQIWYILKRGVETHLRTVVSTALLRNQEVMIDHIAQLLLFLFLVLIVLGETEDTDARGEILAGFALKEGGVIRQRIILARREIGLGSSRDGVVLISLCIKVQPRGFSFFACFFEHLQLIGELAGMARFYFSWCDNSLHRRSTVVVVDVSRRARVLLWGRHVLTDGAQTLTLDFAFRKWGFARLMKCNSVAFVPAFLEGDPWWAFWHLKAALKDDLTMLWGIFSFFFICAHALPRHLARLRICRRWSTELENYFWLAVYSGRKHGLYILAFSSSACLCLCWLFELFLNGWTVKSDRCVYHSRHANLCASQPRYPSSCCLLLSIFIRMFELAMAVKPEAEHVLLPDGRI